ncbi:MAG: hypothetical protein V2J24_17875, partial [Pseudomonadales bacterium]|nr:hypothetical protein [Pseudomonadales bacterium]
KCAASRTPAAGGSFAAAVTSPFMHDSGTATHACSRERNTLQNQVKVRITTVYPLSWTGAATLV